MTPFEAYILYCSLKAHFTSKYDYFKFNGSMPNISNESFEDKHFKGLFYTLAKHKSPKELILANFIAGTPLMYMGELILDGDANLAKYTKHIQRRKYDFKSELTSLNASFDTNFLVKNNDHPIALTRTIQKKLSYDSLIIINEICKFFPYWNKQLPNDFMWNEIGPFCTKLTPFVLPEINLKEYKQILRDEFIDG